MLFCGALLGSHGLKDEAAQIFSSIYITTEKRAMRKTYTQYNLHHPIRML
jgi:hypothetical protein